MTHDDLVLVSRCVNPGPRVPALGWINVDDFDDPNEAEISSQEIHLTLFQRVPSRGDVATCWKLSVTSARALIRELEAAIARRGGGWKAVISRMTAWTLARLLSGQAVNGDADALPEPFRRLAVRLAALPLEGRSGVWEGFLAGRPDADELVRAVADVDPDGPAPEAEADRTEGDWPPLRLSAPPPVDLFPVDVLPEAAARLVADGANAIGCPVDFLAVPALVVAAGAVGRSVALMMKPNYFVPASLYVVCVGPPSDGKTPALKLVAAALRRIDQALAAQYDRDRERWEDESKRPGPDGKKSDPGRPPRPRRIDVDDITLEALPAILRDNPRGLVMIRDELAALLLGLNQYKAGGKGSDRPTLLKVWSGDAITRDRVTNPDGVPVRCPSPCLSIAGGLPPDMLNSLSDPKGRSDGFTDRFLFTFPDALPVSSWSDAGVPPEISDAWGDLVARLWRRPMALKDDQQVPHVARFNSEGKAAWTARYDAHTAEMNAPDFAPLLRGPWGKLRDYAGRLALILACLEHAADPLADPEAVPSVGPRTVANAWRLVAYFKSHARRTHAVIRHGPGVGGGPVVRAVIAWIRDGGRLTFSERDVKQARRWITDDDLAAALVYLTARHAIRLHEDPPDAPRQGRPRSPVYVVNPSLLDTQNPQNAQNSGVGPTFEGSEHFEKPSGGES